MRRIETVRLRDAELALQRERQEKPTITGLPGDACPTPAAGAEPPLAALAKAGAGAASADDQRHQARERGGPDQRTAIDFL